MSHENDCKTLLISYDSRNATQITVCEILTALCEYVYKQ